MLVGKGDQLEKLGVSDGLTEKSDALIYERAGRLAVFLVSKKISLSDFMQGKNVEDKALVIKTTRIIAAKIYGRIKLSLLEDKEELLKEMDVNWCISFYRRRIAKLFNLSEAFLEAYSGGYEKAPDSTRFVSESGPGSERKPFLSERIGQMRSNFPEMLPSSIGEVTSNILGNSSNIRQSVMDGATKVLESGADSLQSLEMDETFPMLEAVTPKRLAAIKAQAVIPSSERETERCGKKPEVSVSVGAQAERKVLDSGIVANSGSGRKLNKLIDTSYSGVTPDSDRLVDSSGEAISIRPLSPEKRKYDLLERRLVYVSGLFDLASVKREIEAVFIENKGCNTFERQEAVIEVVNGLNPSFNDDAREIERKRKKGYTVQGLSISDFEDCGYYSPSLSDLSGDFERYRIYKLSKEKYEQLIFKRPVARVMQPKKTPSVQELELDWDDNDWLPSAK